MSTDVSEKYIISIFRAEEKANHEADSRVLATSKTEFSIATAMRS
jgi:hypothetical protein